MGSQRSYQRGHNDFYSFEYETTSPRVTLNGVSGKVVEKKPAFYDKHHDLPIYGGTSDVYFARDEEGRITQAKVYDEKRLATIDLDWDHTHTNKDGTVFKKGTVHVQEYRTVRVEDAKTGKIRNQTTRCFLARLMTQEEINKYGPLLRHFNPQIKFR